MRRGPFGLAKSLTILGFLTSSTFDLLSPRVDFRDAA